jgi:hypothetical protein
MWRWKILNVEKLQPVRKIKTLFLPENIQSQGKVAKERIPVRSAT